MLEANNSVIVCIYVCVCVCVWCVRVCACVCVCTYTCGVYIYFDSACSGTAHAWSDASAQIFRLIINILVTLLKSIS